MPPCLLIPSCRREGTCGSLSPTGKVHWQTGFFPCARRCHHIGGAHRACSVQCRQAEGCPMPDPTQNRPRPSHPRLRAPRNVSIPGQDATAKRSMLEAVRAALERAGLDVGQLDEERRQSRARLEAALDRFRAASDESASAMQHAVARSAENWLEAHRVRTALAPAAGHYALSTADSITAEPFASTPGLDLLAENIGPWANTAEVVFSEQTSDQASFEREVHFAFPWPNPTGQDLLRNVNGLFGVAATAVV